MEIKDLSWWDFDREIGLDDSIRCPECGEVSPILEWELTEVYCEDCGSHDALRCPMCGENFDHVWSPTFEVIKTASQESDAG